MSDDTPPFGWSRAAQAGLAFRPVPTTAADTLAWWNAQDEKRRVLRAGLKAEREAALLAKLRPSGA